MTSTPDPTDKKPTKRGPKRTYAERQRELRDAELKHIDRLKEREQKAYDSYQAVKRERATAENALNAPVDPELITAVNETMAGKAVAI